jgi:hypothetical protein
MTEQELHECGCIHGKHHTGFITGKQEHAIRIDLRSRTQGVDRVVCPWKPYWTLESTVQKREL